MNANKTALISAFKAMLYVARAEGAEDELKEKYLKLEEELDYDEEYTLTDMIDNIENVYVLLKNK